MFYLLRFVLLGLLTLLLLLLILHLYFKRENLFCAMIFFFFGDVGIWSTRYTVFFFRGLIDVKPADILFFFFVIFDWIKLFFYHKNCMEIRVLLLTLKKWYFYNFFEIFRFGKFSEKKPNSQPFVYKQILKIRNIFFVRI